MALCAVALVGACAVPGPLGGQAQPAPTAAPIAPGEAPASARIAGVAVTETPIVAPPAPTAALAPADNVPASPVAVLTPIETLAPATPDVGTLPGAGATLAPPTLVPNAAAAATANAATAVAAVARAASTATAIPTQEIRIQDFAFSPATITVPAGTYVVFRNFDAATHHVTGNDFDSGLILYGAYWSMPFQRAGTFDYVCSIHPTMRGKIVVTPPNQAVFSGT